MTGLYKAKYIHPSGEERYTFTTQFEVLLSCLNISSENLIN